VDGSYNLAAWENSDYGPIFPNNSDRERAWKWKRRHQGREIRASEPHACSGFRLKSESDLRKVGLIFSVGGSSGPISNE